MDAIGKPFAVAGEERLHVNHLDVLIGPQLTDKRRNICRKSAGIDADVIVGGGRWRANQNTRVGKKLVGDIGCDQSLVVRDEVGAVHPILRLGIIRAKHDDHNLGSPRRETSVADKEGCSAPVRCVALLEQGRPAQPVVIYEVIRARAQQSLQPGRITVH